MQGQPIWVTSIGLQQLIYMYQQSQLNVLSILLIYFNVYCNVYRLTKFFFHSIHGFVIGLWFRERKEREENERLGIVPQDDEEEDIEVMDGGPFRRVDVRELEKKVTELNRPIKTSDWKKKKKSTLNSQKSKKCCGL